MMTVQSPSRDPLSSSVEPLSQLEHVGTAKRKQSRYRPTLPLPYELLQHCITFVDEGLYSQAFSLLTNLLVAGADCAEPRHGNALHTYVPPTQILVLAATLTVHPSMTNRAVSADHVQAANDALLFLGHLNSLVGPSGSNFTSAFTFASSNSPRSGRRRARIDADESPTSHEDHSRLRVSLANHASLWNVAEDFWCVVGWAFNCSVRHPSRWNRWRLWLNLILDVLEDDLEACVMASRAKTDTQPQLEVEAIMSSSLLARYLSVASDGRTGKRRVMRAILADGSNKSIAEFGELWKNETKELERPSEYGKDMRKRLDLREGEFGDYMDLDEEPEDIKEQVLSTSISSKGRSARRRTRSDSTESEDYEDSVLQDHPGKGNLGGTGTVILRQRFMTLLLRLCSVHKQAFLEPEDLLDLFTEFLRPLPLPSFVQFILPSTPYLDPHAQASLYQILLQPLISSDAPTYKASTMTQAHFESHFLPFSANYANYLENARVSVIIEGLLKLLARYLDLNATPSLQASLDKGIRARQEKAAAGAHRRVGERGIEEDLAAEVLDMSSQRMQILLELLTNE